MAKTKKHSKSRGHHKRKPMKKRGGRSRKGSGKGMTRLQAGGQPVFVGAPWNGANTNTWGSTNHYAYNPQGSGSGDPLDIVLGSRNIKPGNMIGGKRRYRRKRVTKKRGRKRRMRGGTLSDTLNVPGNWVRNQIDRAIAGGSKRRRKSKKHSRKKRKVKRKRSTHRRKRAGKAPPGFNWAAHNSGAYNKPQRNPQDQRRAERRAARRARQQELRQYSMSGGYKGDLPFQNAVNLVRGAGTSLGNVVHGFRGFPELTSPYPTEQPGMDPPRLPIPEPADVETLYKTAQVNVGAIGSRA